jgi:DNA topoisomerase-2
LDGTIDLRKKKREEVNDMLSSKGYKEMDDDNDYKYLVRMPMDSVTEENVEKLLKDKMTKEVYLEKIKETSVQKMWKTELTNLKEQYLEYREDRNRTEQEEPKKKKTVVNKGPLKKKA